MTASRARRQLKLGYLAMDVENIREFEMDSRLIVSAENVSVGLRVKQGKHWNQKWRDNVDKAATVCPKPRFSGTIVGYTDEDGQLHGRNSERQYNQVQQGQANWCDVCWDNGNVSVYPIGAQGIYALAFDNAVGH